MEMQIKNLCKSYGSKQALIDIHMRLQAGVYGLLGPNGAGKSTLMNIITDLQNEAGKKLSSFSGGMKQRVLIAQAILGDPKVLILDEPTAGLDPKERIRIRNLIAEIALNRIVILATHVVSDIEFIAKEVILLKAGRLIAKAPPSDLQQTLEGKVYELTAPEEKLFEISSRYKVGNIAKGKDGITVRVVSDFPPEGFSQHQVSPALEDVYLYRFDEDQPSPPVKAVV